MQCIICSRSEDEAELCDGIYEGEIAKICQECAESENIPLIKKPTSEQILTAERRASVRERMEKLSGREKPISKEHLIASKNLNKLRLPPRKQYHEKLVDNYDWILKIARRKKKLTINQLSEKTGIPHQILEDFEKAQIPENFEQTAGTLETALNIRLLKEHKLPIHFIHPTKEEAERILEEVREKIHKPESESEDSNPKQIKEKKQKIKQIQKGKFDFSRRENIQDITLKDLVDLKREREKKKAFEKEKREHKELFGEEIEIEDEE